MPPKPVPRVSPEAFVADWVIKRIPRVKPIQEATLWKQVNWKDPRDKQLFNDHRDAALELLAEEGYIRLQPGAGPDAQYGYHITLTVEGRKIKDEGGYITAEEAKAIREAVQANITWHEGKKKEWDNRTKYFAFSFTAISAILAIVTLWEKCAPQKRSSDATAQHAVAPDSTAIKANTQPKKDIATLPAKKRHPHPQTSNPPGSNPSSSLAPSKTSQAGDNNTAPPPVSNSPLRIAHADNIEFKVMKAAGSAAAQTITITLLLTNSAANAEIYSQVHSIFDPDGNEYLLKSFHNGASNNLSNIPLTTGVPIKCTYTFGGVLPSVRTIRLFTYKYLQSSGHTSSVEFRDIFVEWD